MSETSESPETPKPAEVLVATENAEPRRWEKAKPIAILALAVVGCYYLPIAAYLGALDGGYPLHTVFAPLVLLLIPMGSFGVVIVKSSKLLSKGWKQRQIGKVILSVLLICLSLGGPVMFWNGGDIFNLAFGTALKKRMSSCSLGLETFQSDAVLAIEEYPGDLWGGGQYVPLGGEWEGGAKQKYLEREYETFKPNHVFISLRLGNEPCVFINYGGGFIDDTGILVGSPTFVPDCEYTAAWLWKWADGIYFYEDRHWSEGDEATCIGFSPTDFE